MEKKTIKVESKELIAVEKEITVPYYSKSICYAYKVINQETVIVVEYGGLNKSIATCSIKGTTALSDTAEQINEEEFWKFFNETKDKIYAIAIEKGVENDNI